MEIKVYDKKKRTSQILTVGDNVTLTELAHAIGLYFNLEMFGHTFLFCVKLRRYSNYRDFLVYNDETYFDKINERDNNKSTNIKCLFAFNKVGSKLLFVQDLGDQNEFIITRKL